MAFGEHAGEFVADSLAGDLGDFGCEELDCRQCAGVDGETEPGGESDAAEHAELVLGEAEFGRADGADELLGEVFAAANEVEDGGVVDLRCIWGVGDLRGVEQHAVDGEVAALDVFAGGGCEADGVGAAAVEVGSVVTERGDLGGGVFACHLVKHQNDAEVRAYLLGSWEERDDFGRSGARGYVEVFCGVIEEEIADAATGEAGGVSGGAECGCDVTCSFEGRAIGKP